MDAKQFDDVARTLGEAPHRRAVLVGAVSGVLAALPLAVDAKKKKRKNKKPKVTCSDGVKNGSETDIDCGGPACPRCGAGRFCARNSDCSTARCGLGNGQGVLCTACEIDGDCGQDARGQCQCDKQTGACVSRRASAPTGLACPICPTGFICIVGFDGEECTPLCGG